jgi:hypothetical protein
MPLCSKEEDAVYTLLKCPETMKLMEHLLSRKWLTVIEEIFHNKVTNCRPTNTLELRNAESYLHKFICKWESRIKNLQLEEKYRTVGQEEKQSVIE